MGQGRSEVDTHVPPHRGSGRVIPGGAVSNCHPYCRGKQEMDLTSVEGDFSIGHILPNLVLGKKGNRDTIPRSMTHLSYKPINGGHFGRSRLQSRFELTKF
ncbi:unnamed protein product [Linum trigynum]|uniref:Uncharacterized protein n=1 Tax=Linum trigynum TaxID=586398 RepID=A0AAV2FRX9_9ROSI